MALKWSNIDQDGPRSPQDPLVFAMCLYIVVLSNRNLCMACPGSPPRWPQVGPKMSQRWPQDDPRWAKMAPRWSQDAPELAPELAPRWPDMASTWPQAGQDGLNMAQEGPKLAQDGHNMAPNGLNMAPTIPKLTPTWMPGTADISRSHILQYYRFRQQETVSGLSGSLILRSWAPNLPSNGCTRRSYCFFVVFITHHVVTLLTMQFTCNNNLNEHVCVLPISEYICINHLERQRTSKFGKNTYVQHKYEYLQQ
jgi:hypothetical protein